LEVGESDAGNESTTWPHRVNREIEGAKEGRDVGLWEKVGARLGKDVAEAREGRLDGAHDGNEDGRWEGNKVGMRVGENEGDRVGE
jgi:hypothetical protein